MLSGVLCSLSIKMSFNLLIIKDVFKCAPD